PSGVGGASASLWPIGSVGGVAVAVLAMELSSSTKNSGVRRLSGMFEKATINVLLYFPGCESHHRHADGGARRCYPAPLQGCFQATAGHYPGSALRDPESVLLSLDYSFSVTTTTGSVVPSGMLTVIAISSMGVGVMG